MKDRERAIEMFAMRVDGYTLEEIGKRYGVTRERVRCILSAGAGERRGMGLNKVIYPGVREYMKANNLSASKLANKVGMCKNNATKKLSGRCKLHKGEIDGILRVTGLTYEEAFGGVQDAQ